MVKKTYKVFSIYDHVNKRQRRQQPAFRTFRSPTPTPPPEMQQAPAEDLDNRQTAQSMGAAQSTQVHAHNITVAPSSSPAAARTKSSTTASPTAKLPLKQSTIEAVRRARRGPASSKPPAPFVDSSSDEAEEASPAEEVDRGSRALGITTAALYRKEQSPNITKVLQSAPQPSQQQPGSSPPVMDPSTQPDEPAPQGDATPDDPVIETVEQETYGPEHRRFFMLTRRSLRGRQTVDGEHTGAKTHVPQSDSYFEICEDDELFDSDDDTASMPVSRKSKSRARGARHDTAHEEHTEQDAAAFDEMDVDQASITPDHRTRTRSMAPPSTGKRGNASTAGLPQSDAEAQKFFVDWTAGLIMKTQDLEARLESSANRVTDFQDLVLIRDGEIEKLKSQNANLSRRAHTTTYNETQVRTLRAEIEKLREEVSTANAIAEQHHRRSAEQSSEVVAAKMLQSTEKASYEKQIQDLHRQINALKAQARPILPPSSPASGSRGYNSALSRALGRPPSIHSNDMVTPPGQFPATTAIVEASKYDALRSAAKEVISTGAAFVGGSFGPFGMAMMELKDEVEKEPKREA